MGVHQQQPVYRPVTELFAEQKNVKLSGTQHTNYSEVTGVADATGADTVSVKCCADIHFAHTAQGLYKAVVCDRHSGFYDGMYAFKIKVEESVFCLEGTKCPEHIWMEVEYIDGSVVTLQPDDFYLKLPSLTKAGVLPLRDVAQVCLVYQANNKAEQNCHFSCRLLKVFNRRMLKDLYCSALKLQISEKQWLKLPPRQMPASFEELSE